MDCRILRIPDFISLVKEVIVFRNLEDLAVSELFVISVELSLLKNDIDFMKKVEVDNFMIIVSKKVEVK